MPNTAPHMLPEQWLHTVFSVQAVNKGGVIRRSVYDIERIVGRQAFVAELKRRGFRAVENGGQFVIFCNQEDIKIVT